jgi:UDP-glucose 4-epimerase
MKIAVTGGTGFIGKWFLRALPTEMDAVVISRRSSSGWVQIGNRSFSLHVTDYSRQSMFKLLSGCDAVVHLAAQRPGREQRFTACLGNVTLDCSLFLACLEQGVQNIIFVSSRGVYGDSPDLPWRECNNPRPTSLYALAKLQTEIAAGFFNRRGLNIKSLRLAQVLGLGEKKANVITTFLKSAHRKEPLTITAQGVLHREYIYVKDAARAMLAALAKDSVSGVFNVGTGEMCSLEELVSMINNVFDNAGNVQQISPKTFVHEESLMDSSLFKEIFSWRPQWNILEAIEDIHASLQDKTLRDEYGFTTRE